ncbi:VWA domain-containing protein [Streptosporangiaceae bacterium NEAU-GS5]|nr:VWA domain-containing protein [Streptosporangiaceae bacterium NEAU-GS5]
MQVGGRGGGPALIDRHVGFLHALREHGLPVSLAEGLDAAKALTCIDLSEREVLREAYAATVVKRPAHRPGFDALFDLWFPPVMGETAPKADGPTDPREQLAELLKGDPSDPALAQFAREMVARFGQVEASPGRQSWFSYPVLRALSPGTLVAGLLNQMLPVRGGLPEQRARTQINTAIKSFEDAGADDVRRRIAEEAGIERIAKSTVKAPIDQRDFLRATRAELAELRREVYPLARRLAARLTIKQKLGHRGRLDFRRTVRASLSTGGVPLNTRLKPKRPHRPELVILCDASDSVAAFSHFTLLLTVALREQFTKVRAFAFVDTVDEITAILTSDDLDLRQADIRRWGRTNYGHVFDQFAERYGDALGPKSSLLILGDARSNYQPPALDTLKVLAKKARHAYWLNPEPHTQWDTGDSLATAYGSVVAMSECRNVAQLSEFIQDLA